MADNITCPECGCPYDRSRMTCPECGAPNTQVSAAVDINGYATECSNCGAPANGYRVCQWCGSPIRYIGTGTATQAGGSNKVILECEFKRILNDRSQYAYIICHVNVNGHELMQVVDDCSPRGMVLQLLGVQGMVLNNLQRYPGMHSFYNSAYGVFERAFGVDFSSAAQVAAEILRQVYEVTSEQVSCAFEYGQQSSGSDNVAAAAIGGVLLGAFLDNL